MRKIAFAAAMFAVAAPLSGCVTAEEYEARVAAADDDRCQSYGSHPGSDGYLFCRMTQDNRHERENEQSRAANDALIEEGLKKATTGYW